MQSRNKWSDLFICNNYYYIIINIIIIIEDREKNIRRSNIIRYYKNKISCALCLYFSLYFWWYWALFIPHYKFVSPAWEIHILVIQCFRVVYRGISHQSLVLSGIHMRLYVSVYTKKTQVTSGIFHGCTVASKESQCMTGRLGVIQLNCNDR